MWAGPVFTFPRGDSLLRLHVQDKDIFKKDCMGVAQFSVANVEVGEPQAIWVKLEVRVVFPSPLALSSPPVHTSHVACYHYHITRALPAPHLRSVLARQAAPSLSL
jgi:hypothetical protein